jgi:hypothetical protein
MVSSFRVLPILALAFSALAVPLVKRDNGGGIILHNKGSGPQTLYFYENSRNGNGNGDPRFGNDHLPNAPTLQPGETKFVSLDLSFKGRVQRGTEQPATWAEFQIKADNAKPKPGDTAIFVGNDGLAHGDISVQQGNDGPVTIKSPTGDVEGGFTKDYSIGAPEAAFAHKTADIGFGPGDGSLILKNGKKALGSMVGNWAEKANPAVEAWYKSQGADEKKFYFQSGAQTGNGTADIGSTNNQLEVTFY